MVLRFQEAQVIPGRPFDPGHPVSNHSTRHLIIICCYVNCELLKDAILCSIPSLLECQFPGVPLDPLHRVNQAPPETVDVDETKKHSFSNEIELRSGVGIMCITFCP